MGSYRKAGMIIDWVLMLLTVLMAFLAGKKQKLAWLIGLGSQFLWLWFDYKVKAFGLMPLAVILGGIYLRNFLLWRKDDQADL